MRSNYVTETFILVSICDYVITVFVSTMSIKKIRNAKNAMV